MDPEDAARLVVLDALQRDPTLFMALRHLGWIDANQIVAEFPDQLVEEDPVAAIIAAAPVLPPPPTRRTYEIVREEAVWQSPPRPRRPEPATQYDIARWATRARPSAADAARARSEFSRWVEGEIDYYPGVAGDVD